VADANGLKLDFTCQLWNNDLVTLVKKDLNAWVSAKTAAVNPNTAACTAEQAGKVISAVQASSNLAPCSKDAGFEFIDFFANATFLPSGEQINAAAASKSCAALVADANGLKLDFTCQLWNNDLATLVKKDLNAWVTAKTQAVAPTSTTLAPTSSLPTTSVPSSVAVCTISTSIVGAVTMAFFI
jgi:hypothetical protein